MPVKTKTKLKPKAKKKPLSKEIMEAIFEECRNSSNLIIMDYNAGRVILIKKHVVCVRRLRNNHQTCMQPMEDFPEREFFHTFMIRWKSSKKEAVSKNLIDIGFPIITVESVYGALEAIRNQ